MSKSNNFQKSELEPLFMSLFLRGKGRAAGTKAMMPQNHHFSLLLPLTQTFSKARGIFNSAASEARSEAAASDSSQASDQVTKDSLPTS